MGSSSGGFATSDQETFRQLGTGDGTTPGPGPLQDSTFDPGLEPDGGSQRAQNPAPGCRYASWADPARCSGCSRADFGVGTGRVEAEAVETAGAAKAAQGSERTRE